MNTFDPIKHQYFINDRPVPSVTQILRAILGDAIWQASDWYLDRGQAVHQCAALVAQGKQFEYDPVVKQQVFACERFFKEVAPEVIEVERAVFSSVYNFAGTPDLICKIGNHKCVVDFKSSLTDIVFIQLGGYAALDPTITRGMGVELRDDGKYKCTDIVKIDRFRNEFLACLSVLNIRQRLKINKEVEDGK